MVTSKEVRMLLLARDHDSKGRLPIISQLCQRTLLLKVVLRIHPHENDSCDLGRESGKRFKVHNFVAPCLIILFLYMTCVGQRSQVHLCVRSRWLIFVILWRMPREQRKGESSISWLMACLVNLCFITKKCRQQQDPHTYLARCRCCATFALTKLLWLPGNISFPLAEIWVFLATADRSQWLQAQRILLRFGNSMHGRSQCLCDELNLPFRRRGVKVMLLQSAIGMVEK